MSANLILTKIAGERPPILPPIITAFDGAPDEGDSWLTYLQDDVRMICRQADAASVDRLETFLEPLDVRKRLVLSEIWAYEATEGELMSLPPFADLPIDYLIERPNREQRILQGLINKLDECHARCERRLARHQFEVRLIRDLGASDL